MCSGFEDFGSQLSTPMCQETKSKKARPTTKCLNQPSLVILGITQFSLIFLNLCMLLFYFKFHLFLEVFLNSYTEFIAVTLVNKIIQV